MQMVKQVTIVVAVIRNQAGEILLAQRNQPEIPEIHGLWEFVGGGVKIDEDPIDAIKREVSEEIGVEVSEVKLLHEIISDTQEFSNGVKNEFLILTYECKIISGTPTPCDPEIAQIKYVPLNEVKNFKAFNNIYQTIQILQNKNVS
jgi:mutator protein MutT